MARIDGGELLARALAVEGVEAIFSIADISQSPMLKSAEGAGIRHIGPRHESAGTHMAEAWWRTTGKMAAVFGAAGPGVANMIPGIMCAWAEGQPLIALGAQRVRRSMWAHRNGRFQFGPQLEVVKSITKFSAVIEETRRIPEFVREAARRAVDGRPGPVYLDIPADILMETLEEGDAPLLTPSQTQFHPGAPGAAALQAAADVLAEARFPVILAGQGVNHSAASDALVKVAEQLGALVMTTPGARGAMPENHPLSIGPGFPAGSPAHINSDAILAVGTQLGEMVQFLSPPSWAGPKHQRLVHLDSDPMRIGVNRVADVALVGDARAGLEALVGVLADRGVAREPNPEAAAYVEQYRAFKNMVVGSFRSMEGPPLHPGRVAAELGELIPEDAIVCLDGGCTGIWSHLSFQFSRPRSFMWTGHYGHLGTGLPYAIGAKLAAPDRPVVLMTGDGAFGFNMQELETAVRVNAPIVVVINCDYAWGMEDVYMEKVAGTKIGVKMSHVRYDQVASGLGCHSEYVQQASDFAPAFKRAMESGRPAVVQVDVDPEANAYPPGLDDFAAMYGADFT